MTVKTHRKRTIASALTFRAISTFLLWTITYAVSGEAVTSVVITVIFAVLATVLFYFNDRAWERTNWGRKTESAVQTGASQVLVSRSNLSFPSALMPLKHEFLEEAS